MHAGTSEIAAQVRQYIIDNFMYAYPNATLGDDEMLLARGIIDSLGVVELIGFVEQELGVTIPDRDITEANLGSVSAVAQYVAARRAAEPVPAMT